MSLLLAFFVASAALEFALRQLRLNDLNGMLLGAFAYAALIAVFMWIAFRAGVLRWIPSRNRDRL